MPGRILSVRSPRRLSASLLAGQFLVLLARCMVWSCHPATTLNSLDESLMSSEEQSPQDASDYADHAAQTTNSSSVPPLRTSESWRRPSLSCRKLQHPDLPCIGRPLLRLQTRPCQQNGREADLRRKRELTQTKRRKLIFRSTRTPFTRCAASSSLGVRFADFLHCSECRLLEKYMTVRR